MSEKYTPGPWDSPLKRLVNKDDEGRNFSLGDYEVYPPIGESGPVAITATREDAQLIAAAPELLEALYHMQHCRSCAEGSWEDCDGGRAALAAISKAEGRE